MTSSSNKTYRELAIPYFLEVFKIIDEVMLKHNAPYYLIGATATALQLLEKGIQPGRGTKDIDFAIMISTFEEFDSIKDALIERGFNKVYLPWTLYHDKYEVAIDLLPFGQIEEKDTVTFTERAVDIVVLGFKESMEEAKLITLDETYSAKVLHYTECVCLNLLRGVTDQN